MKTNFSRHTGASRVNIYLLLSSVLEYRSLTRDIVQPAIRTGRAIFEYVTPNFSRTALTTRSRCPAFFGFCFDRIAFAAASFLACCRSGCAVRRRSCSHNSIDLSMKSRCRIQMWRVSSSAVSRRELSRIRIGQDGLWSEGLRKSGDGEAGESGVRFQSNM
jgi:hypothetical protein